MDNCDATERAGLNAGSSLSFEDHDDWSFNASSIHCLSKVLDEGAGCSGPVPPPTRWARTHHIGDVDDEHLASLAHRWKRAIPGESPCPAPPWVRLDIMAFGQQSGPPASAAQLRELAALLKDAGHVDFRDARGPMGFTQRQAGGKFSRDEAEVFITQLQDAASTGVTGSETPTWRLSAQEQTARALPTDVLAEELRRRGWIAVEVPDPAQDFPAS